MKPLNPHFPSQYSSSNLGSKYETPLDYLGSSISAEVI
jgi:hypothetical protein